MLRTRIHPFASKIEIMSVDGFQGREKEAVLISLVRYERWVRFVITFGTEFGCLGRFRKSDRVRTRHNGSVCSSIPARTQAAG